MDPMPIFNFYYPEDNPLRRLLLKHSMQVREKALSILESSPLPLDREEVVCGAMLHDIGIFRCHAPGILCTGTEHYLRHGLIGGMLLREYGSVHQLDLERFARICERHTGSGLTAEEIRQENLPLPEQNFLPETPLEKLICLADKFYSKSGDLQEKPLEKVRRSMAKFGPGSASRFEELLRIFRVV